MRLATILPGFMVLAGSWVTAATSDAGITGHMAAHMASVAIAAPLIAYGIAGTSLDPATRWPLVVAPLQMSIVELLVVWGWHVPAARGLAASSASGLVVEQAMFLTAGLLLWSACFGTRGAHSSARRAAGIMALLLTTMHMTLLGALIALAPRILFGTAGCGLPGLSLAPLPDQQIGGVVMLVVGGGSYLLGGLVLLFGLLRNDAQGAAQS